MAKNIEASLADWVCSLTWSVVPDRVNAIVKLCVLDSLSVGLAGTRTEAYRQGRHAVLATGGVDGGTCSVLASPKTTTPAQAAWLNGIAMHALDFDDTSYAGILHASAVVLPAAMAATEHAGGTFTDMLTAYLAGVEVELALGASMGDSLYARGHWTTSALGVLGAAVACARAHKLPSEQTAQAIRLALNLSIGTRSAHGTSSKPYLCGMAARLGLEAAFAAGAGICTAENSLAGRYGYAEVANNGQLSVATFESVGVEYRILNPGMALKVFPVCSASQAAIQAALELQHEHGFSAHDVQHVTVLGTPLVASCLIYSRPQRTAEAQFSMQFAIATALLCQDVGIEHLNEDWIQGEALQSYLPRVELTEDSSLVPPADAATRYPEASRVDITLSDGRVLTKTVMAARGMPQVPLGEQQLAGKFLKCARTVYPAPDALALYERLSTATDGLRLDELLACVRAAPGGSQ